MTLASDGIIIYILLWCLIGYMAGMLTVIMAAVLKAEQGKRRRRKRTGKHLKCNVNRA